MQSICSYKDLENISLEYDEYWTQGNKKPALMHSIHNYPAKFPPFIVEKAINYAVSEGVKVKTIADIFCGCGTTALEAKSNNYSFWGCDINPVATLISRTKVANYDIQQLKQAYDEINRQYSISGLNNNPYLNAPERLKYWFTERLQPLFHNAVQDDFQIILYKNEDVIISKAGSQEDLLRLLTEKSVFIVSIIKLLK